MKTRASCKKRQGGAVAIIVGFSLVLLIGFLAMVIDLGHLYLAKSELQNGADAAALSGAKQLNGTIQGINDPTPGGKGAVQLAIATAAKNNYDFTKPIDITIDNIEVGACPEDSCMVPASSVTADQAAAATFVKVDTHNRDLVAWFAPIWNIFKVSTYGMAVAGRYTVDISPVGICQLPDDLSNPNIIHCSNPHCTAIPGGTLPCPTGYEFGYERGVAYKVRDANPLGPGTMFWIDPVATAPGTCTGSTHDTLPYMCTGKIAFTPGVCQYVYTNTGISDPQLEALDSRFDVFNNQNKCDPATAPPDSNVKEYKACLTTNNDGTCKEIDTTKGSPSRWMNTDPGRQSLRFVTIDGIKQPVPWATREFSDYGVLWSASRPTVAASDATDATVSARWESLYHAGSGEATNYPQSSPYAQDNSSSDFFHAPSHTEKPDRRVLNITIVDCTTVGGSCRPATVLGIGRFIMQRKANIPTDKDIYVEFAGLLPMPFPPSEIRLYR